MITFFEQLSDGYKADYNRELNLGSLNIVDGYSIVAEEIFNDRIADIISTEYPKVEKFEKFVNPNRNLVVEFLFWLA